MGRAIVRRPALFLMDEPLSNLDSGLRAELRAEISGLVRELGVTTIYVTHDQAEALTMADRVAIMRKGVLQDVGTPTQVYGRPGTLYVAAFLGSPRMNLLEASVYVHLDRYVALHLGEQALYLPWHDIRARAGGALPRRADRGRRPGRGAHPGRARTRRATCCRAGSATSSTTVTSRWPSSTSAPPRSSVDEMGAAPPSRRGPGSAAACGRLGQVVQRLHRPGRPTPEEAAGRAAAAGPAC